jgi:hypothetical protein
LAVKRCLRKSNRETIERLAAFGRGAEIPATSAIPAIRALRGRCTGSLDGAIML